MTTLDTVPVPPVPSHIAATPAASTGHQQAPSQRPAKATRSAARHYGTVRPSRQVLPVVLRGGAGSA